MQIKKPDIIIFDIDDTLYGTKDPHYRAINASFKFINKITKIDLENIEEAYKRSRKEIKLLLGNTAASHSRLLYFQRLLETYKNKNFIENSLKCEEIYWSNYLDKIILNDKVPQLFKNIHEKNIMIAIATDLTVNIQMKKLIKLEISRYIDALVTSEESGKDKPNFDCFSLLNEKINPQFKPLNYWMVGDSILKDLKGAKIELKATTFLVREYIQDKNADNQCVDFYLNSVSELSKFI